MTDRSAQKFAAVSAWMQSGWHPLLLVDSRAVGVALPAHLVALGHTCIQVGWGMPNPIRDLQVDRVGVSGYFSFGGRREWVCLPWACVYGVQKTNRPNEGAVWWPADLPTGVRVLPADARAVAHTQGPTSPGITETPCVLEEVRPPSGTRRLLPAGWGVIPGGRK